MKNHNDFGLKNGSKVCKSSELFCKAAKLKTVKSLTSKENTQNELCSLQLLHKALQSSKPLSYQLLIASGARYCRPTPSITRGRYKPSPMLATGGARFAVVHRINFDQPPQIGTVLMREGQRYLLVEKTPHTKLNGEPTTILSWESHCADCGDPFVVTSGLRGCAPVRRCKKHRRAGVPVAKRNWRRAGGAK